ncbi:hypothetical protein FQN57_000906 [Myotisia sp. PD_48]|nr:hypothetical protein FQN57_000906 [Myotisia sp. PD_48]
MPVEVLVLVFQCSENPAQVTALSSVCKRFYSVWMRGSGAILEHVLSRQILAFDDALMAVRATQIVRDAVRAGQLPPDPFPTDELSGSVRRPSIDELKGIYDLHHLVKCIEQIFIDDGDESWYASSHFGQNIDFSSDPPRWRHWRARFHSTLYRVFLAGAMLYRVYQAPHILPDDDRPSDFLQTTRADLEEYRASEDGMPEEFDLTESDISYLLKFPAFNFESYVQQEPVFGQLAELLFTLSKNRILQNNDIPAPRPFRKHSPGLRLANSKPFLCHCGKGDPVKGVLYYENMQLLLIIELLTRQQRSTEVFLDGLNASRDATGDRQPFPHKMLEPTEPIRKVSVVLFGRFFLEEIYMPRVAGEASIKVPVTIPVANQPGFRDTDILLSEMFNKSGQLNHYTRTNEGARPPLQCVQYIFRRYFNLEFSDPAFEASQTSPYRLIYADGDLFFEHHLYSYCTCDMGHWTAARLLASVDKLHDSPQYRRTY